MKRCVAKFAVGAAAVLLSVTSAVAFSQATHDVHMAIERVEGEFFPEFYFEPSGLYIEPGDTVRFIADSPFHTVTALHQAYGYPVARIPEDVEPFSSPVVQVGSSWEYTFEEEGVYDIVCAPHIDFGMAMRIVVGQASGPGAQPVPEQFANQPGGGSILSATALDPQNIIESGTVSWSEFGPDNVVLPFFMQDVEPPQAPEEQE